MRSSKPFEARGQQRQRVFGRELLDHVLGQLPPLRAQRDHAVVRGAPVDGVEGGRDDVDA